MSMSGSVTTERASLVPGHSGFSVMGAGYRAGHHVGDPGGIEGSDDLGEKAELAHHRVVRRSTNSLP